MVENSENKGSKEPDPEEVLRRMLNTPSKKKRSSKKKSTKGGVK